MISEKIKNGDDMGGYGSGRKFGASCTDDYLSIDVRQWQRDGYLVPGLQFHWQWTHNGEKVAQSALRLKTDRYA